ncbi:MAG: FtsQ-type POTRA domain-containing protein [Proteobacteria bacterium]|nr:FtsQ-type POTRA domain-containing protein [Pseudomonadota bacterium]
MGRKNVRALLEKDRKKKTFKRFLKRFVLFFFVFGLLILFATQTYSLTKPMFSKELSYFTRDFLMIKELAIVGVSDYADREIRSFVKPIIDVNPNILTFPVENIKLFLATRPYISKAVIRKELPDRIVLDIKEKKPVAIFFDGELKFLDENGEIIRPMSVGENIDVPVISVDGVEDEMKANLLKMGCYFILLDNQSTPYILPSEVRLNRNYIEIKSLELKTANNYIPSVYISYDELEKKILNLKKLWTDIVNKKENIEYIDARYSKGISVKQKNISEVKDGKRQ